MSKKQAKKWKWSRLHGRLLRKTGHLQKAAEDFSAALRERAPQKRLNAINQRIWTALMRWQTAYFGTSRPSYAMMVRAYIEEHVQVRWEAGLDDFYYGVWAPIWHSMRDDRSVSVPKEYTEERRLLWVECELQTLGLTHRELGETDDAWTLSITEEEHAILWPSKHGDE